MMDAQIVKDKLCLKLEQSRNEKTWKEIDDDDSQDQDLIKGYLLKIQESSYLKDKNYLWVNSETF